MDQVIVYIAGLESSGNHWVRSVLSQNPEIRILGAQSLPSGYHPNRHYPTPTPDQDYDVLVVVARDSNCQQLSVERMNYNRGYSPLEFTHETSVEKMKDLIIQSPEVVFVSYETALLYGQVYWDSVFESIGVAPVTVKTNPVDGNRKYLK